VPDPEDVDPRNGSDLFKVGQAPFRFDLGDQKSARVERTHFLGQITALVVIVRETEGRAPPSVGRVCRRLDDRLRLTLRLDHGHRQSERA